MPDSSPTAPVLGRDLIAGLVVFLVALPLCLGIALASGAPLLSGLVSGIVGGVVVGALSGSPISVSGPAAGMAAIVVAQIQTLGSFDAFLLAVALAGGLQIALGLAKGGSVANSVPNNVLKGLLAAIGILLILKQLPHLLGHDADFEGDESFLQRDGDNTITAVWTAVRSMLPGAALVGLTALGILVVWDRSRWKNSAVPSALIAVMAGVLVNLILEASGSSWAIADSHMVAIPVLGADGLRLRDLIHVPDLARITDPAVYVSALTLAAVASLETLLTVEATAKLDPLRRPSLPNRELVAQGVGNLLAGAIGGLPMTSVIVRSSVNINAGGRTRRSTITHGVLLLLSVLFLAQWLNHIPLAALAALLIMTGFKLAHPSLFVQKWRAGLTQFVPFLSTVLAIVFTDLLIGVLIGLSISLSFVLARNLRGGFRVIRESRVGGLVHRIEFANHVSFLNRARLLQLLARFSRGDQVMLDARLADYVDADLLSVVREFAEETATARGIRVSLLGFQERYKLRDVVQYVDFTSREVQSTLTPAAVLQILRDGNERFLTNQRLNRDMTRQIDATKSGQHPMAIVLSCIDSRAPAEMLFDLGIGDIFSCRIAGHVARQKVLGSIEFACKVAGSKLVVVLGHTSCGAVKATCEFVGNGIDPVAATGLTNLPAITSVISAAVHSELHRTPEHDCSAAGFVDRVAATHVANTIRTLQEQSPTLAAMLAQRQIGIVGAMYDVSSGRVRFLDGLAYGVEAPSPTALAPSGAG